MNIRIETVSDIRMLRDIEAQWNSLVYESSENPFLFPSLAEPFISLNMADGWSPMIVTISSNEKLLGIVPLTVRKIYGLRLARFILSPAYSPDFIIRRENRNCLAPLVIDYLFKCLGCHVLSLDFKANSEHLMSLLQECKRSNARYSVVSEMGHRVLPIRSTWQDFEKNKGGNFRRKFRKIERNLDRIGAWKVVCVHRNEAATGVLSRILEVEKESWKETYRVKKGAKADDVLMAILKGLNTAVHVQPNVDWTVWFLEMDGHPIAYTLVILYADVAYITKTSYNARYKRFYPGIYINHVAIRQLWETKRVRLIDFLTDLQFMETWTDDVEGCTRVVISKNPILSFALGSFFLSGYVEKTLGPAMRGFFDMIPELEGF